jgi:hypothetical protein
MALNRYCNLDHYKYTKERKKDKETNMSMNEFLYWPKWNFNGDVMDIYFRKLLFNCQNLK